MLVVEPGAAGTVVGACVVVVGTKAATELRAYGGS